MRGCGKGSAQGGVGEDGRVGRAGCAVGDEARRRSPPHRHRQPLNRSSATRGTRGGRSRGSRRSDASRRPRPPSATPHPPPPAAAGRHQRLPPLPRRRPRVAPHPPPPGARPSRRRTAGCVPAMAHGCRGAGGAADGRRGTTTPSRCQRRRWRAGWRGGGGSGSCAKHKRPALGRGTQGGAVGTEPRPGGCAATAGTAGASWSSA